jgi:hypothetical protein
MMVKCEWPDRSQQQIRLGFEGLETTEPDSLQITQIGTADYRHPTRFYHTRLSVGK